MTHIVFRPHILQLSWYSLKEIPPCVQKSKKKEKKETRKRNKHYKVYKYSKYFYLESTFPIMLHKSVWQCHKT